VVGVGRQAIQQTFSATNGCSQVRASNLQQPYLEHGKEYTVDAEEVIQNKFIQQTIYTVWL
jgi:hypothetical protein